MQTANTVNLMAASEQWRDRPADQRFTTLAALRESVHGRRQLSRAADIELGKMTIEDQAGTLVINHTIAPCEPSHWAFGQLANAVKAPAAYLRTLPRPLLVDNLRHGIANADKEAVKFMTIANPEGEINRLQAVTSTTYGRIWDADCVEAAQRIVERSGGKFYNPLAYDIATGAPKPSGLYANKAGITTCEGHALSGRNQCLIALQCPTASIVGGFRQWIKQGRAVKKGQHGAMIWVPTGGRTAAPAGDVITEGGAEPAGGGDEIRFCIGTVFDIGQTVELGADQDQERDEIAA